MDQTIKRETYHLECFKITIRSTTKGEMGFYHAESLIPSAIVSQISQKCLKRIIKKEELGTRLLEFHEVLEIITDLCYSKASAIKEKLSLSVSPRIISYLIAFKLLNLSPFFPLFLDKDITEFHVGPNGSLVIDHTKFGRLLGENVPLSSILALKSRIEFAAKTFLIPSQPSAKAVLHFGGQRIRASIDSPPLTPNGIDISVRKMPSEPFSMKKLVLLEMIDSRFARFLIDKITSRSNIAIVGEPYAGKTTLANALLAELPSIWKIIIIEDAEEIRLPLDKYPNLTNILVPPVEKRSQYTSKSDEITKLLHRSPDYVFIGEIQNKEHTASLFEGYNAGIRGMHTVHADSIQNLIRRWVFSYEIPLQQLATLDYLVLVSRTWQKNVHKRVVEGIYQIMFSQRKITLLKALVNSSDQNNQNNKNFPDSLSNTGSSTALEFLPCAEVEL